MENRQGKDMSHWRRGVRACATVFGVIMIVSGIGKSIDAHEAIEKLSRVMPWDVARWCVGALAVAEVIVGSGVLWRVSAWDSLAAVALAVILTIGQIGFLVLSIPGDCGCLGRWGSMSPLVSISITLAGGAAALCLWYIAGGKGCEGAVSAAKRNLWQGHCKRVAQCVGCAALIGTMLVSWSWRDADAKSWLLRLGAATGKVLVIVGEEKCEHCRRVVQHVEECVQPSWSEAFFVVREGGERLAMGSGALRRVVVAEEQWWALVSDGVPTTYLVDGALATVRKIGPDGLR